MTPGERRQRAWRQKHAWRGSVHASLDGWHLIANYRRGGWHASVWAPGNYTRVTKRPKPTAREAAADVMVQMVDIGFEPPIQLYQAFDAADRARRQRLRDER